MEGAPEGSSCDQSERINVYVANIKKFNLNVFNFFKVSLSLKYTSIS